MNYVILAGGVGERLWPLGSPEKPKQFHAVIGDEPLVVQAVRRIAPLLTKEGSGEVSEKDRSDTPPTSSSKWGRKIYFSTIERYVPLLKELFPDIPDERYIVEPARRDTGPAMAYVAAKLAQTEPDEPVAFIPSDHVIKDEERFVKTLQLAESLIRETGKMLDIGVPAKFPSTVLGYTHVGEKKEQNDISVYTFLGHTEKPDLETAEKYVESGEYLWHANYYMWTPAKILEALKKYAPEMHEVIMRSLEDPEEYKTIEKISFDYAITEHMDPKDVTILGGDFGWSDVGAWDTLFDELAKSKADNVTRGEIVALDTEGSIIHSESGRKVGVIGLKDMVVVDTEEGLLVCPKDRAQEVKKLLQHINTSTHQHK